MKKPTSTQKPVYKRARFYIYLIVSCLLLALLLLVLSVVSLKWINPPATAFTLRYDWKNTATEQYSLREWWVPANELPLHLKWAVVASEDQLFWDHNGFDIESIKEAWEQRQTGERTRGASTITQQVAKNLFLSPAQSFLRKGIEAGITILIELFWSKERILEIYLNIAEFGPGIYGVGLAAEEFWGINANSLTPDMSARLAAVLPNPSRMRVEPPTPFTQERSRWILRQMTNLSGISYIQIHPDSVQPDQDIDPMLREAERELEDKLFRSSDPTPSPTGEDSLQPDSFEMEIPDLPDSLLNLPDST